MDAAACATGATGAGDQSERRLAATLYRARRGAARRLPAAGLRLGGPEAAHVARGGCLHGDRPDHAATRHHPRRGRHARGGRRAAGGLLQLQNPLVEFCRRVERGVGGHRRGHQGEHAVSRARPGPRPRARLCRCQPHPRQEQRRRQGRSAGRLLQHQPGADRQHRRRPGLEPDSDERPAVRRQHELGPVRVSAHEDLLPAARGHVAEDDGPGWTVDGGRHAAAELREAAGRRELERGQGRRARPRRGDGAESVRQQDAGRAHPVAGRSALPEGGRHRAAVGAEHRVRPLPPW